MIKMTGFFRSAVIKIMYSTCMHDGGINEISYCWIKRNCVKISIRVPHQACIGSFRSLIDKAFSVLQFDQSAFLRVYLIPSDLIWYLDCISQLFQDLSVNVYAISYQLLVCEFVLYSISNLKSTKFCPELRYLFNSDEINDSIYCIRFSIG